MLLSQQHSPHTPALPSLRGTTVLYEGMSRVMKRKQEEQSTKNKTVSVPHAMFPFTIRANPFLNCQHGKTARPQAVGWEICFPYCVICLSASTLSSLPSPASESFLWVLALSMLSQFFPPFSAKQLLLTFNCTAYLITACSVTLAFCTSAVPRTATQPWPHLLSHSRAAQTKQCVLFSHCLQRPPFCPPGLALQCPQDAAFPYSTCT